MLGIIGLLVCSVLSLNAGFIKADPLTKSCTNNTLYDSSTSSGKIYRTNLDLLLTVLTSNASRPTGFYNFTTGTASEQPANDTTVYGLFLCRGDIGTSECQTCVQTAVTEVLQLCPDNKVATIWYDNCMLRYSNQPIFSKVDAAIELGLVNTKNVTDRDLFRQVFRNTFDQVSTEAAATDVAGKKFAVMESNASESVRIFALGQCTPDISDMDCRLCLGIMIQRLADYYYEGGRAGSPSCNVRYEMYLFYNVSAPPMIQPPNSVEPAISKGNGSSISTGAILAIVVVPILIMSAVVLCLVIIRKRKPHTVMEETIGLETVEGWNAIGIAGSKHQGFLQPE